jgi:dimethylaniline monooxygenase (N-oxide forming)
MQAYFENFANTFLDGKIHFETEVLRIRRDAEKWALEVEDKKTHLRSTWRFARIVVCTGVNHFAFT